MTKTKAFADRASDAARLVEALLERRMTSTEIAATLKTTARTVERWKAGSAPHPIFLEGLRKLASKKGVEL